MKKRRWIGVAKFIFERQRGYLAILNTLILFKLYFEGRTFQWWWLLSIPLFVAWTVFDMKVIYRQERSFSDEQSDVLMEIKNGKK